MVGNDGTADWRGYDRFLEASGNRHRHGPRMLRASDWGQGKNCTLYMWNNVHSGNAGSPEHRNPKQFASVKIDMTFRANPGVLITVIVWGDFEGSFDIDGNGRVLYKTFESQPREKNGICPLERYDLAVLGLGRPVIETRVSWRGARRPITPEPVPARIGSPFG